MKNPKTSYSNKQIKSNFVTHQKLKIEQQVISNKIINWNQELNNSITKLLNLINTFARRMNVSISAGIPPILRHFTTNTPKCYLLVIKLGWSTWARLIKPTEHQSLSRIPHRGGRRFTSWVRRLLRLFLLRYYALGEFDVAVIIIFWNMFFAKQKMFLWVG